MAGAVSSSSSDEAPVPSALAFGTEPYAGSDYTITPVADPFSL